MFWLEQIQLLFKFIPFPFDPQRIKCIDYFRHLLKHFFKLRCNSRRWQPIWCQIWTPMASCFVVHLTKANCVVRSTMMHEGVVCGHSIASRRHFNFISIPDDYIVSCDINVRNWSCRRDPGFHVHRCRCSVRFIHMRSIDLCNAPHIFSWWLEINVTVIADHNITGGIANLYL